MSSRAFRTVAPSIATLALVAALIASGTPTAGATGASSAGTPNSFRGTTPSLSSVAAAQRTAAATGGGSAATAFESGWLRTHQIEGQELEGGEAIRMGEVAAPKSSSSASVTNGAFGLDLLAGVQPFRFPVFRRWEPVLGRTTGPRAVREQHPRL